MLILIKVPPSHGIGEYLLMACLGLVGNLKSKLKSNWIYTKIGTAWKWKCETFFQMKLVIYLQTTLALALVCVSFYGQSRPSRWFKIEMKDKLKVHENWSKYDLKLSTKLNQIFWKHLLNLTDLKETLLTLNLFSTSLKVQ